MVNRAEGTGRRPPGAPDPGGPTTVTNGRRENRWESPTSDGRTPRRRLRGTHPGPRPRSQGSRSARRRARRPDHWCGRTTLAPTSSVPTGGHPSGRRRAPRSPRPPSRRPLPFSERLFAPRSPLTGRAIKPVWGPSAGRRPLDLPLPYRAPAPRKASTPCLALGPALGPAPFRASARCPAPPVRRIRSCGSTRTSIPRPSPSRPSRNRPSPGRLSLSPPSLSLPSLSRTHPWIRRRCLSPSPPIAPRRSTVSTSRWASPSHLPPPIRGSPRWINPVHAPCTGTRALPPPNRPTALSRTPMRPNRNSMTPCPTAVLLCPMSRIPRTATTGSSCPPSPVLPPSPHGRRHRRSRPVEGSRAPPGGASKLLTSPSTRRRSTPR
ncbi:MAG: hypothetical protein QG622_387 [Actinomycetota bacterium]|nr:hypothetical protein [Actinomycetota bacterium]